MKIQDLTEVLATLLNNAEDVAKACLKNNGDTPDDCALAGFRVAIGQAEAVLNGLEQEDMRVLSEDDESIRAELETFPKENLVLSKDTVIDVLNVSIADVHKAAYDALHQISHPAGGSDE